MSAPDQCVNCTGSNFTVTGYLTADSRMIYRCDMCGQEYPEEEDRRGLIPCENPNCSNWIYETEAYCRQCSP